MTRTIGTTETLLKGVALWLADLGLAHYDENGTGYDGSSPLPVVFLQQNYDKPDSAITLWRYFGPDVDADNPDNPNVATWRIQVACRTPANSDSLAADRLADLVYDRLHGARHVKLPNGTELLLCKQVVSGLADLDASGRFYRADSYELLTNPGEMI